jgi:4-amino-4-deoxy-L-arabinose transferase-like glycosyltransferase
MGPVARHELSIEQVQRWVVSFLILAVASFPLGALTAVIHRIVDDGRRPDGMLLLVVMAALGVLALGAIRLVHKRPPLSPWLLCGVLPAVVAALLVL